LDNARSDTPCDVGCETDCSFPERLNVGTWRSTMSRDSGRRLILSLSTICTLAATLETGCSAALGVTVTV